MAKLINSDQLQTSLTRVKQELDKKAGTSHGTHVSYGTSTGALTSGGTGAAGTSASVSRADHTHTLPAYPTTLKNPNSLSIQLGSNAATSYDGSAAKSITITASSIGAAGSSHGTHVSYGTTTADLTSGGTGAAGTSTSVSRADHTHALPAYPTSLKNPNSLKIQLNGTDNATYDGSAAKTVNITASSIGAAGSSHGTHVTYGTTTTSLTSGGTGAVGTSGSVARADHTHTLPSYPTTLKNPTSLSIQLNGGTATTYDGSTAKSINITASSIGAAGSSHGTHVSYGTTTAELTSGGTGAAGTSGSVSRADHTHTLPAYPTSLKNPNSLTLQFGGTTSVTYDGSSAKTFNVTLDSIGAAKASHGTHVTYGTTATSLSSGGTGSVGTATSVSRSDHTHTLPAYPTTLKNPKSLTLQFNGTTNQTYDGSEAKTFNVSAANLGVLGAVSANGYYGMAKPDKSTSDWIRTTVNGIIPYQSGGASALGTSSWPFNNAYITTVYGALSGNASTATKLATSRKINNVSFDGSSDITVPLNVFNSAVGSSNAKPYHRILCSEVCTGSYTDKVITIMASGNYSGGRFGIFKVILRTNGSPSVSTCDIEWMVRKGFDLGDIVYNMRNTFGNTIVDVFYKCPNTYNSMTWTVLDEGVRNGGGYGGTWTKYSTKINNDGTGTEVYTETEMKAKNTYTSTLNKGTDTSTVNYANSAGSATSATSAGKLTTARTLTIGSTGKTFDGSGNVSWSLSEIGAAASSHGTHVSYGGNGSATTVSRSDHTHTAQTTITGNAGTATTLQTARTINGTSFNGSANITTTNWGTSRTITIGSTGKSVNGSGNVSWSLSEIGAAAASHGTHVSYGGNGSASTVSRSDHTHSGYLSTGGGTLTGDLTLNKYLKVNAWSGYGTGTADVWYDGTNKALCADNATTLKVGGNAVYHEGNKPVVTDLAGSGNGTGSTLSTVYFKNSATDHAARVSCYQNSNGLDYAHVGLYSVSGSALQSYINIYEDYTIISTPKLKIGANYISIGASGHSSPLKGDVWIQV